MRHITGLAGCPKGSGSCEMEDEGTVSVRVVDAADQYVALRIGTHPECARLTPVEARHIANLLRAAAARAEKRSPGGLPTADDALTGGKE